jgi:PAS domain S-box-containing protein
MADQHVPPANLFTGQRQARLAARLLQAPVALVWQHAAQQLLLVGAHGLSEAELQQPDGPVSSLARWLSAGGPEAEGEPRAGFAALAVAPREGLHATPALIYAVADRAPRAWGADELAALDELAAVGATELRLAATASGRARAERFEVARRQCFDALLAGRPLPAVLDLLARGIEGQLEGGYCAVMLLDETGLRLRTAAAPSIAPAFTAAIEGESIGPTAGSCGAAAYLNTAVIVEDIATDLRWAPWRDRAIGAGLRACWSIPVRAADGRVLGTFALYYGAPRQPGADELELVRGAANIVALALEHSQALAALRASEASLRRSEANLAALLNHATEAIWSLDREGRLIIFNQQAAELFQWGRRLALVPGMRFVELLTDEELGPWQGMLDRALRGERVEEEVYWERDGVERWFEVSLAPLTAGAAIVGVAAFLRDTSERRRAEAARLEMERAWQETQRLESLGVLASGIAHDFNNLLAVVLGHAELLLAELDEDSPHRDSLQQIIKAARRGSSLTQQILAYADQGRLANEPLDLNALIRDLAELVARTLPGSALVSYQLAEGLPLVGGDAVQLQQLLMNLLTNAAEAIGEGEGQICVATELTSIAEDESELRAGRYVRLQIADTGPGMDEATLRRIFQPFFTTRFLGRGLGLAVAQGIVRGHRGGIQVSSEPGAGTTVRILLPVL